MRAVLIGLATLASILPATQVIAHVRDPDIVVDGKGLVREYYGVPLDLTLKQLAKLPFRHKVGKEMGEGSYYPIAIITARKEVKIKVSFSNRGTLFRFETSTPGALGLHGLGVGSTLAELQKAFPSRRPYWGMTPHEEYYATFGTGTRLTYHFSPFDLPKEAWSRDPKQYELDPSIKVKKIKITPITAY